MSFSDEVSTSSTNNNSVACKEKKQDNCKGKMYKITINNYDDIVCQKLKDFCFISPYSVNLTYSVGFEIGTEEETPHIHVYLRFQKETRRTTIKNYLGREFWCELVKKSRDQTIQQVDEQMDTYNQKDGDSRNYTNVKREVKVDCLSIDQLRPFQRELLKMTKDSSLNGKITWIYDDVGQTGKTEFLRHYVLNHDGMFTYGGKCTDIINLVYNNKNKIIMNKNNCLIFNLGRDTDPRKVSYKAMEQVIDGCICNTKFEAGAFICNKINIIVLANCLPKFEKITKSRWIIKTVTANHELTDWVDRSNFIEDSNSEYEL